jgi:hypothetical protein
VRVILYLAWLMLFPSLTAAQARITPSSSMLFGREARGPLDPPGSGQIADTARRDIRPTYWLEGALVGSAVGAVGGLLLGQFICEQSEGQSCGVARVAAVVGTAVLVALPGALIGGQFTKGERGDSSHVK